MSGTIIDTFIKGSDNIISKVLTEDEEAINVAWTEIEIAFIGQGVTQALITRTSDGDGISFASGVLEITPGALTEDLSALAVGRIYNVVATVKTASDIYGVSYGREDSDNKLYMMVSEVPS